jgi:hypothetical protein
MLGFIHLGVSNIREKGDIRDLYSRVSVCYGGGGKWREKPLSLYETNLVLRVDQNEKIFRQEMWLLKEQEPP